MKRLLQTAITVVALLLATSIAKAQNALECAYWVDGYTYKCLIVYEGSTGKCSVMIDNENCKYDIKVSESNGYMVFTAINPTNRDYVPVTYYMSALESYLYVPSFPKGDNRFKLNAAPISQASLPAKLKKYQLTWTSK